MDVNSFQKYQEKLSDTKGKFMMPLFWGWAYPFIKFGAAALISAKIFLNMPWYLIFIIMFKASVLHVFCINC